MDINIYNDLFNDFKLLNDQYNIVVNDLKNDPIDNDNPYNLPLENMIKNTISIIKYNSMVLELINKLESIDKSYTKKYKEQFNGDLLQKPKLPQIFILFRKLINNLNKENYEECNRLKNKILTKY
ncbi:MAG: hypothetical protein WDA02_08005 [Saccharofermentanales bacterium]|jgi:hypothetical protein